MSNHASRARLSQHPMTTTTTTTTQPPWLTKSQSASHQKSIQRILQQRENTRTAVRSLHLKGLDPPRDLPRQFFDYYSIAISCARDNAKQNRYSDIQPYDRTRVTVEAKVLDLNPIFQFESKLTNIEAEVSKCELVP
jgi:protein-tyrosine phosphatase